MSRNVEVVRAAFQAFDTGDVEGILRLCDERVEITQPVELPGVPPRQHGHAGVREALAIWPEQWDDFRHEIVHVTDVGDEVLVTAFQSGRGKGSGVVVETQFSYVFSLRAGKIVRWRIFLHEEQALSAVGLGA